MLDECLFYQSAAQLVSLAESDGACGPIQPRTIRCSSAPGLFHCIAPGGVYKHKIQSRLNGNSLEVAHHSSTLNGGDILCSQLGAIRVTDLSTSLLFRLRYHNVSQRAMSSHTFVLFGAI